MPLDRGEPRASGALERFDDVVGGRRDGRERPRQVLDGLVVPGIDVESLCDGRRERRRHASRVRPHGMRTEIARPPRRVGVVGDAAVALRRQVLPERPAEGDVHDLEAPADPEDGRARFSAAANAAKSSASRSARTSSVGVAGASP